MSPNSELPGHKELSEKGAGIRDCSQQPVGLGAFLFHVGLLGPGLGGVHEVTQQAGDKSGLHPKGMTSKPLPFRKSGDGIVQWKGVISDRVLWRSRAKKLYMHLDVGMDMCIYVKSMRRRLCTHEGPGSLAMDICTLQRLRTW